MMLGSRTARSAAASWTAIATGSLATGGGSSRGVGVGCGLAVAVGPSVADCVGEGADERVTDAAGTVLVGVHAARTKAAYSRAAAERDNNGGIPTLIVILMNGPASYLF
jgi:hypothetical protein